MLHLRSRNDPDFINANSQKRKADDQLGLDMQADRKMKTEQTEVDEPVSFLSFDPLNRVSVQPCQTKRLSHFMSV